MAKTGVQDWVKQHSIDYEIHSSLRNMGEGYVLILFRFHGVFTLEWHDFLSKIGFQPSRILRSVLCKQE